MTEIASGLVKKPIGDLCVYLEQIWLVDPTTKPPIERYFYLASICEDTHFFVSGNYSRTFHGAIQILEEEVVRKWCLSMYSLTAGDTRWLLDPLDGWGIREIYSAASPR